MRGRCNFLPQARDIIVNRPPDLSTCARMAIHPCTVRRSGCYGPDGPTTMCHPCATPYASIHTRESKGRAQSVNARERV